MSALTHLECALCGKHYPARQPWNLCVDCGRPLWVRYDLKEVARQFTKPELSQRPATMWRYRELLPVDAHTDIVSLGETMTPLLEAPRLAAQFGLSNLFIKDESRLPTGSFKARGMALAVTMAKSFGLSTLAAPTAGNAGGALAAYAARAGLQAWIFMPEDSPAINQKECALAGARAFAVNGLIDDCGRLVREGASAMGWFDFSTLKEPYRIEGKKTMGLELAEQCDWVLPDWIFYPTGGGTGLLGMWKAFEELAAIGWLRGSKRPRIVACQSDGCAPIVRAWDAGERFAKRFENARTIASGLRVPQAVGDFMILDALRASDGVAVAVAESEIPGWMSLGNSEEGIAVCPETAVCLGALHRLVGQGRIGREDRVVIFNTGAVHKYPEAIGATLPRIDLREPVDWEKLARRGA